MPDPYRRSAVVDATFRPARTDDIRGRCAPFVGKRMRWTAEFPIEEGPYAGQMAWVESCDPDVRDISGTMLGWVPTCDLADVVVVDRGEPAARVKRAVE